MAYFDKSNAKIVPSWLSLAGKHGSRASSEFESRVRGRVRQLYYGLIASGVVVD